MDINQARTLYHDGVIVWYPFRLGGQFVDHRLWCAEKSGEVLDYNSKKNLVREYLAAGERVFVMTLHRDKTVSLKEIERDS